MMECRQIKQATTDNVSTRISERPLPKLAVIAERPFWISNFSPLDICETRFQNVVVNARAAIFTFWPQRASVIARFQNLIFFIPEPAPGIQNGRPTITTSHWNRLGQIWGHTPGQRIGTDSIGSQNGRPTITIPHWHGFWAFKMAGPLYQSRVGTSPRKSKWPPGDNKRALDYRLVTRLVRLVNQALANQAIRPTFEPPRNYNRSNHLGRHGASRLWSTCTDYKIT